MLISRTSQDKRWLKNFDIKIFLSQFKSKITNVRNFAILWVRTHCFAHAVEGYQKKLYEKLCNKFFPSAFIGNTYRIYMKKLYKKKVTKIFPIDSIVLYL